jgi:hypothetical protein
MKSSSPAYDVVSRQFLSSPITSGCRTTGFFEAADFGSPNLSRTKLETTRIRNLPQSTCSHFSASTSPILNPVTAISKVNSRAKGFMRQMMFQASCGVTRIAS